jgi:hypothetical protein
VEAGKTQIVTQGPANPGAGICLTVGIAMAELVAADENTWTTTNKAATERKGVSVRHRDYSIGEGGRRWKKPDEKGASG